MIRVGPRRSSVPHTLPPPGLHGFTREREHERARVHLRVESDGSGLLLINADRALHLNPSATLMAWLALKDTALPEAIRQLQSRFRVSAAVAERDYLGICHQLEELTWPGGACPVHDLELELLAPFSRRPSAPYRMDLALTYLCNNDCPHCYNARPRSSPELPTPAWKSAIDRLWEVGVPHLCFTGGEATLRNDLPELVKYAQDKGQITGLLTNGRRLSDERYLNALVEAGLDHVQITLESHRPEIHDRMVAAPGAWAQTVRGIRNALEGGLYVMTNTTLLAENSPGILETLDFLADLAVPTVGVNALIHAGRGTTVGTGLPEQSLEPLLEKVRARTEEHGQRLIWYTPTQYCAFDPVQLELGVKGCTAALYNMCVEPDGGVIPCQSYYRPLGNLLSDSWESIWNHPLSAWLRERQYAPAKCAGCLLLAECGAGCPLTLFQDQDFAAIPAVVPEAYAPIAGGAG